LKTKFLLVAVLITLSCNIHAQTDEVDKSKKNKYELTSKEEDLLDRSTLSYRANELQEMYAKTAINQSVRFDRNRLLNNPLSLPEVMEFNHPYLNVLVSELTESDRDAIIESKRMDEARYQRFESIMITAMKFATQSAMYERTRQFYKDVEGKHRQYLVQIFPFHILALEEGKIRAPMIEEIGFSREIETKRTRRDIKKRYRISRQAEVMNVSQTYMDFFTNLMTKRPKPPNIYMLPLDKDELEYWRKGALNGWVEGNRLANEIIRANIRMAMREFTGQLRFHYLARAQIISYPTSQNINVGTNSNGLAVNIGESVFEITELPRFNDQELEWIALPQVDDIFDELTQSDVDSLTDYLLHAGDLR
jgi:hypothetical protein